jgi:hypothetical protein
MARTNAPDGRHITLIDGGLFMVSQDRNNVYHVPKEGNRRVVAGGIALPAAFGWDSQRGRLLVPQMAAALLGFYPLD